MPFLPMILSKSLQLKILAMAQRPVPRQDVECGKKPGQDALEACKKDLCTKRAAAQSEKNAADTQRKQAESVLENKKQCLLKAKCTLETYQGMDYSVGLKSATNSESIKKNSEEYLAKDGELATSLKGVAQTLKLVKEKIADLKAAACMLDTCVKDSCNAQQIKIIEKTIPDFKQEVADKLISVTNATNGLADTAFIHAVEITGIQTFSNVDSLVELSKNLQAKVKEFKSDLDGNVKERTDEVKKSHEEYAAAVVEFSKKTSDKRKKSVYLEGLAFSLDFICLPTDPDSEIDIICEKVKDTFRPGRKCRDHEEDDGEDGSPRPLPPYQQQQSRPRPKPFAPRPDNL
jgi:hypothetical protein